MHELTRALALVFTAVVAQVSALLPHHAHVAPIRPPAPPEASPHREPYFRTLSVEQLVAVAKFPADPPATQQVRLPNTGAARPVSYTGSIPALIQQAFAPLGSAAVAWAERVALCESGDNPNARNASGAAGLFQIMPGTWAGTPYASQSPFNAVANARAAAWIFARRGGSAWSCS